MTTDETAKGAPDDSKQKAKAYANLLQSWADPNVDPSRLWDVMEPELRQRQLDRQFGPDADGEVFP